MRARPWPTPTSPHTWSRPPPRRSSGARASRSATDELLAVGAKGRPRCLEDGRGRAAGGESIVFPRMGGALSPPPKGRTRSPEARCAQANPHLVSERGGVPPAHGV